MNKKDFIKIWKESDCEKYYQRMDFLKSIGFTFEKDGNMKYSESLALSEWLDLEYDKIKKPIASNITDPSEEELKNAVGGILKRASYIQEQLDQDKYFY
jgi:hypothetical protein